MSGGASKGGHEAEWATRKKRIDPKLDACGWVLDGKSLALRTEEEDTDNGPADYALWLDGRFVAVVEAKKLTVGPQNVLTQAERYSRGVRNSPFNFNGSRRVADLRCASCSTPTSTHDALS